MTTVQDVRYTLIGEDNSTVLPDTLVNLALSDAANLQASTDTTAVRLYAAYLIAKRWGSLGRVKSSDGQTLEYVDAKELLEQYNSRVESLNTDYSNTLFKKVSTNKDLAYDEDDFLLRSRRTGDY